MGRRGKRREERLEVNKQLKARLFSLPLCLSSSPFVLFPTPSPLAEYLSIYIFSILSSFIPFELRLLYSTLNASPIPSEKTSHASLSHIKIHLQKTGSICVQKCWLISSSIISYRRELYS